MKIKEKEILKNFTTLKVGGRARYFCRVKSVKDLESAVSFAKQKKLPIFILGGGSNVLIGDDGFPGLVIKMEMKGVKFKDCCGFVEAIAFAGENWDDFVKKSVAKKLFGAENLSGIPGTVGASPVQNIGAYGAEVKDIISWVEVYDTKNLETKIISAGDCRFGYRESIFKKAEDKRHIIIRVAFVLKKNGSLNTSYKDIEEYFLGKKIKKPSLAILRKAILEIRKSKMPDLEKCGTAGSFFKNPIILKKDFLKIKEKYPDIKFYEEGDGEVKISLAWVLDKICGLKGHREGNVGLYEKHSLVLINHGEATAKEILRFANKIAVKVKKKTGLKIKWEVDKIS